MSDMNGGYTLNSRGLRRVERAAVAWAGRWEDSMRTAGTHERVEEVYSLADADRRKSAPDWLESDEDYATYFSECRMSFDLESASDAAHVRIDPNYFAE